MTGLFGDRGFLHSILTAPKLIRFIQKQAGSAVSVDLSFGFIKRVRFSSTSSVGAASFTTDSHFRPLGVAYPSYSVATQQGPWLLLTDSSHGMSKPERYRRQ